MIEKEETIHIESTGETINLKMSESHKLLFGGDQLTAVRARSAIRNVANGDSTSTKLLGLVPVIEDWHTKMTLLVVCHIIIKINFNTFYACVGHMETFLFIKVCRRTLHSLSATKFIR